MIEKMGKKEEKEGLSSIYNTYRIQVTSGKFSGYF